MLLLLAAVISTNSLLASERVVLHSEVLGEGRPLNIVLPDDYSSGTRYPVVYALDGDATYIPSVAQRMHAQEPGLIVVGIENVDRTRDMFPNPVDRRGNPGGGETFLEFLVEELIPYVEENYSTDGFRVLSGQSNSGLFTLYAMFQAPDAFDAFLASSPMIGWDPDLIRDGTTALFENRKSFAKALYINHGESDGQRTTDFLPGYVQLLESAAPKDFRWKFEVAEGYGHVPESSYENGIAFIFVN